MNLKRRCLDLIALNCEGKLVLYIVEESGSFIQYRNMIQLIEKP